MARDSSPANPSIANHSAQKAAPATEKLDMLSSRGVASLSGDDEASSHLARRIRVNMARLPQRFDRNDKVALQVSNSSRSYWFVPDDRKLLDI